MYLCCLYAPANLLQKANSEPPPEGGLDLVAYRQVPSNQRLLCLLFDTGPEGPELEG